MIEKFRTHVVLALCSLALVACDSSTDPSGGGGGGFDLAGAFDGGVAEVEKEPGARRVR